MELYKKRQRLWESIRETEAEIVQKETKQQKGNNREGDVISVNTQTEEDPDASGEDEKWKKVNKSVSWKTGGNRKQQIKRSRYENLKLDTANRFDALQGTDSSDEDEIGKKKRKEEDLQERSQRKKGNNISKEEQKESIVTSIEKKERTE